MPDHGHARRDYRCPRHHRRGAPQIVRRRGRQPQASQRRPGGRPRADAEIAQRRGRQGADRALCRDQRPQRRRGAARRVADRAAHGAAAARTGRILPCRPSRPALREPERRSARPYRRDREFRRRRHPRNREARRQARRWCRSATASPIWSTARSSSIPSSSPEISASTAVVRPDRCGSSSPRRRLRPSHG